MRCRSQNQSNKQQETSVGREHSPTKENSLNSLGSRAHVSVHTIQNEQKIPNFTIRKQELILIDTETKEDLGFSPNAQQKQSQFNQPPQKYRTMGGSYKSALAKSIDNSLFSFNFEQRYLKLPDPSPKMKFEKPMQPKKVKKANQNYNPQTVKSLKSLSKQVKELVFLQKQTCYKDIAETLVERFKVNNTVQEESTVNDSQNIRRRVYDSINVMIALGVLEKENKTIIKGNSHIDTNSRKQHKQLLKQKTNLIKEKALKEKQVQERRKFLTNLTQKIKQIPQLIQRNIENENNIYSEDFQNRGMKFMFPLVIASTLMRSEVYLKLFITNQKDLVLLEMSNSKREMRLYSKNKINIGGDLDALVMLEERKLSYIEKVIEINDNEF